jgi:hypothetical protein
MILREIDHFPGRMYLFSGKQTVFPEKRTCSNRKIKEPGCLISFQNRNRMKLISPDPFPTRNGSGIIGSELR